MPFSRQTAPNVSFISYGQDGEFPADEFQKLVFDVLHQNRDSRVAIMADEETLEQLPPLDSALLDSEQDYRWSGYLIQKKVTKRAKRVFQGTYEEWFKWYMRSQRFRAFQTIVLIEPSVAVSGKEYGGYIDGLLARLTGKARQIVIASEHGAEPVSVSNEQRTMEVLRALLYGTRLSKPSLVERASHVFISIPKEMVGGALEKLNLHLSKQQTRYQLDAYNEQLLQGMVPRAPPRSEEGEPGHFEQLFRRNRRFRAETNIPDRTLAARALEDVIRWDWVTVPFEAERLATWLRELNQRGDYRIRTIYESNGDISNDQWDALLAPTRRQVRRVLDRLVGEVKLERRTWYREVGRPALAYMPPGKSPFLQNRCGQCAFYASAKRRCNLWWLANQTTPHFYPRWRQSGSRVTEFEIHKMRYASRIGPHSSACVRFLDKKRDHLRKAIPNRCEICGEPISPSPKSVVRCRNCTTRYIRFRGRVRVMTAYEHEFNRTYQEATGADAKTDYEEHRRKAKENFRIRKAGTVVAEDLDDALAEEVVESEPELPRVWPTYSQTLQEQVDQLAQTTDIARKFSIAMALSAQNAIRRIITFAKLYHGDADPVVAKQQQYLAQIKGAGQSELLPYEAQLMKQYWLCYGLALKRTPQVWFGPRKRSRYVTEFVEDSAARARGYSPVDAAVNYLHQRRLRQAERINKEVGFPGTCDGFLHRERYNSRKMGLLFDMIDPFKFADREELLLVLLDQGLTWKDFRIEADRRGLNFYYPMAAATSKLDQVGLAADNLAVKYQGVGMQLSQVYKVFAKNLLQMLTGRDVTAGQLQQLMFEFPAEAQ